MFGLAFSNCWITIGSKLPWLASSLSYQYVIVTCGAADATGEAVPETATPAPIIRASMLARPRLYGMAVAPFGPVTWAISCLENLQSRCPTGRFLFWILGT